MSFGPCLCGDTACPRCFPGGQQPEECPICGGNNYDEEKDVLLDEKYATCGKSACIEKAQQLLKEEAEAEEAEARAEAERVAEHQKSCNKNPKCKYASDVDDHEYADHLDCFRDEDADAH